LKRSGDIKAIGIGINTDAALNDTAARIPVDFCLVAMPCTLLDQASLHRGMARCLKDGVSVIIGSPFASGILATGSRVDAPQYAYSRATPDIQERVRKLESACTAYGVPLVAAALQFVLAHPAVVSVVPGAARPIEIEANATALETPIPSEFWRALKAEGLVDEAAPVPETIALPS
jgi:D-threo-aldose 1-dehydrogenase